LSDVKLSQTDDDGEIEAVDGVVTMGDGLASAVYLSLFGGNEQDDGTTDNKLQWWGNAGEPPDRQQRSALQHLLRSLPAIPANLRRLEAAAGRDLAWLVPAGAATRVLTVATMPGLNTIRVVVLITGPDGTKRRLEFSENWKDAAQ